MNVALLQGGPATSGPDGIGIMSRQMVSRMTLAGTLAVLISAAGIAREAGEPPLALNTAKVTIAGTSNVHDYTASTTDVRLTRVDVAGAPTGNILEAATKAGTLTAFEVSIPAATLVSGKDGLDKNMYKALKTPEHPDITFRLLALEHPAGALKATGVLKIAGVERQVTIDLTTQLQDGTLKVTGELALLMTDFGITPPKAMLGMLKTDPKVTVTFETVLGATLR